MGKTQLTGNLTNAISQDASNNVGIGAAPSGSYKLEVTGTGKVSGVLTLSSTISNGTYTYTLPSATGTIALTSDLTGYVTLATTQTISGAKTFSSTITATQINLGGGAGQNQLQSAFNNDFILSNSGNFRIINNLNTVALLTITNAGAATFSSSVTATTGTLSTAYNGGSVGQLHITSSGTEGGTITFEKTSGTAQKYKFGLGTTSLFIYNETAGNQPFTLTSGGVVLVNQTSLSAAQAGTKMQIATDVLATGSLAGYFWENRTGGVTSTSNWYGWYATLGIIQLYNGSTNIASINTSTGVYTPLTPSDIRIKDNVRNYNKGLNDLLKINVKEWDYNGKAGTTKGEKGVGFVANELEQAIPEWVGEFETYLDKDDKEKTKLKNINVNELPYLMINAIQELNERLNKAGL